MNDLDIPYFREGGAPREKVGMRGALACAGW